VAEPDGGLAVTGMSNNPLDVSPHDHQLHDEAGLTAHLIIAASDSDGHLSQDEIDRLLGIGTTGPRWVG
jgi:hypothetical protein